MLTHVVIACPAVHCLTVYTWILKSFDIEMISSG